MKGTTMVDHAPFENLIGGELRPARSGAVLDSINPTTGEVWVQIPLSDASDVADAVDAADAAFPAWSALTADERRGYLERISEVFAEHGEELAQLETSDNGMPLYVTQVINGSAMQGLWKRTAHATLPAVTGRSVVLDPATIGMTRREPFGVFGVIVPFNMPVAMFSSKVALALAAGNTVVAKPPEQASAGILRLTQIIAEMLPPGVLNVVSGLGGVGDAIVRHRKVEKISMTGSPATAKLIQAAAAETLTPSIFELGGKSPNIVFADADLDLAALGVTLASVYTFNAGQACVAGSRILVQRPIVHEMIERIRAQAESIVIGDPRDAATAMGPLISKEQYDKVVHYLEIGRKEADLLFGGRHGAEVVPSLPGGYWVEPTLFMSEDNSIQICREEIFGPVAVLIPFDTDDEAIAIANDSDYGLAAGVWTSDLGRVHRMTRDIKSGNVWVNTYLQTRYELPFGGIKESGYGHDDIMEYTREKSIVIAVYPGGSGGNVPVDGPQAPDASN
jgi:aldehyde dehydrogenase (NAD+)